MPCSMLSAGDAEIYMIQSLCNCVSINKLLTAVSGTSLGSDTHCVYS